MEKSITIKYLRISAKKLRMILDAYKGKKAQKLLESLGLQMDRGAQVISQGVKSALSLFQENERPLVTVKNLTADKGPLFKRFRPGSRGMAKKYSKKTAHLTITLAVPSLTKNGK